MGNAAINEQSYDASAYRFALVASRYNDDIVTALIDGARTAWQRHGGREPQLTLERVPGAFELPLAAQALIATRAYDAVVALGCVIRGDTPHFDYVSSSCTQGLLRVTLDTGVPVSFGVLTVETRLQALQRAAPDSLNKGGEALETALAMASLLRRLK